MPRWRCFTRKCAATGPNPFQLGYDFKADVPVCPKCGRDGRLPENDSRIVRLVTLHFAFEDAKGPIATTGGRIRVACQPERYDLKAWRVTAATSVVTCEKCRESPAFAEALRAEEEGEPWGGALATPGDFTRVGETTQAD